MKLYTDDMCWFLTRYVSVSKHQFWSKQGIDGPTTLPFVGNLFDMLVSPLLYRLSSRQAKFGPVYGTYQALQPQLVVSDPEMIKDILIRDWFTFADRSGGMVSGNPITDNFLTNLSGEQRIYDFYSTIFVSRKWLEKDAKCDESDFYIRQDESYVQHYERLLPVNDQ